MMTEPQVTHEVISTPFQVAMDCKHVSIDADHVCWNCTVKIIDMAEAAEARAAEAEAHVAALSAECDDLRRQNLVYGALSVEAAQKIEELRDTNRALLDQLDEARRLFTVAVNVIKAWNGDETWELYLNNAPEMKEIRDVLEVEP